MNTTLMKVTTAKAAAPQRDGRETRTGRDLWIYATLAALVYGTWRLSQLKLFTAGDDTGYRLGVAGGTLMLLLFVYPLRKYVRALQQLGKLKWWFVVHMVLGVAGPLLILLHANFQVHSTNAAVALYSMIVVACSGVVGRFLYMRVHRGLSGERAQLAQLQSRAGLDQSEARSRLHFAPKVEAMLLAFSERELNRPPRWTTWLGQVLLLPLRTAFVHLRCVWELRQVMRDLARRLRWDPADRRRRERLARKLVYRYLGGVVRVAQFTAFERFFALWHVAHVPFIYLMALSAIVHVIAVHAY
jgi:hypothetical protein